MSKNHQFLVKKLLDINTYVSKYISQTMFKLKYTINFVALNQRCTAQILCEGQTVFFQISKGQNWYVFTHYKGVPVYQIYKMNALNFLGLRDK